MTGYNLPPGVTGNEYAIAGPDYEKESHLRCPEEEDGVRCGGETMEQGYGQDRWIACYEHGHVTDLPPDPGDDPDRKYDEERDRRMLAE